MMKLHVVINYYPGTPSCGISIVAVKSQVCLGHVKASTGRKNLTFDALEKVRDEQEVSRNKYSRSQFSHSHHSSDLLPVVL
jgi:hypothetical protein